MKKYINARDVLPDNLIKEIQKYVKGQHIYIPQDGRKKWGSETGLREEMKKRNEEIFRLYSGGKNIASLAKMFHLSEERIRGIIYEKQTE